MKDYKCQIFLIHKVTVIINSDLSLMKGALVEVQSVWPGDFSHVVLQQPRHLHGLRGQDLRV